MKLRRRHVWLIVFIVAGVLIVSWPLLTADRRPLPPGTHKAGVAAAVRQARLLTDITGWNAAKRERIIRQEIVDAALAMIAAAHTTVVTDMFLWNAWQGPSAETHRALADTFADALGRRRRERPDLDLVIVTDPINTAYAGDVRLPAAPWVRHRLPVVLTDLSRLRDSNRYYAPIFRMGRCLFGNWRWVQRWLDRRDIPHPFGRGAGPVSRREIARLLQFKANHRKVLVCDDAAGNWHVLVTSLNPHDGSSAHSNVALVLTGPVAVDAALSELDCATWSLDAKTFNPSRLRIERSVARIRRRLAALPPPEATDGSARAWWLTEGAIRGHVVRALDAADAGAAVRIAMFYLADRHVVRAIKSAARRGAVIRIILDPNKDAFGHAKSGIPNRQVAAELVRLARRHGADLALRWADTHGEQFHTKAMSIRSAAGAAPQFVCGSANWTRRNIGDLNMEACAAVVNDPALCDAFDERFDAWWVSEGAVRYTVPYAAYAESGPRLWMKTLLYRFQEWSGLCTF